MNRHNTPKWQMEAKAAAANRNAEIKAHGTQVSLSPVDRIQAIAAAEKLAPYGKSILEAADFGQAGAELCRSHGLGLSSFQSIYARRAAAEWEDESVELFAKFRSLRALWICEAAGWR